MDILAFLENIEDELDGQPFVLACRNDICLNANMYVEWLEEKFGDAVADTLSALTRASNHDKDLRLRILSGEGDDEVYAVVAYFFNDTDEYDRFIDEYSGASTVEIVTELEDMCESMVYSMFGNVCEKPEIRELLR